MTEETLNRTNLFFDLHGTQIRACARSELWQLQKEAQREIYKRFCQDLSRMNFPTPSFLRHLEAQIKMDYEL